MGGLRNKVRPNVSDGRRTHGTEPPGSALIIWSGMGQGPHILQTHVVYDAGAKSDWTGQRMDEVRIDKWLWAARFFKTRSLAADAIDLGRIEVNDERCKRSRHVALGDRVRIRRPPFEQVVVVRGLSDTRGPAAVASTLYEETPESVAARERLAAQLKAMGPPVMHDGRPTKKDRRDTERWRGRR